MGFIELSSTEQKPRLIYISGALLAPYNSGIYCHPPVLTMNPQYRAHLYWRKGQNAQSVMALVHNCAFESIFLFVGDVGPKNIPNYLFPNFSPPIFCSAVPQSLPQLSRPTPVSLIQSLLPFPHHLHHRNGGNSVSAFPE